MLFDDWLLSRPAQVTGVVLLSVGLWWKFMLSPYMLLISSAPSNAPYVLAGTGSAIVLFGLFGCFATCRGRPWMLKLVCFEHFHLFFFFNFSESLWSPLITFEWYFYFLLFVFFVLFSPHFPPFFFISSFSLVSICSFFLLHFWSNHCWLILSFSSPTSLIVLLSMLLRCLSSSWRNSSQEFLGSSFATR